MYVHSELLCLILARLKLTVHGCVNLTLVLPLSPSPLVASQICLFFTQTSNIYRLSARDKFGISVLLRQLNEGKKCLSQLAMELDKCSSHQVLYFGVVDMDLLPYVGIASQLLLA
jgi:hypothetical protein